MAMTLNIRAPPARGTTRLSRANPARSTSSQIIPASSRICCRRNPTAAGIAWPWSYRVVAVIDALHTDHRLLALGPRVVAGELANGPPGDLAGTISPRRSCICPIRPRAWGRPWSSAFRIVERLPGARAIGTRPARAREMVPGEGAPEGRSASSPATTPGQERSSR